MKHFKLTSESKVNSQGVTLFRIELIIDCKWGTKGTKGGWIERKDNVSGTAWVYGNAEVYGNAKIYGDAWVYGNAEVYGNAKISGDAWVSGNAKIYGTAWVYGNAKISGDAWNKSPLQIQGTRHFFNICAKGKIRIGCKENTFEFWNNNFEQIGKEQQYTPKEVEEYSLYIKLAMELYVLNE